MTYVSSPNPCHIAVHQMTADDKMALLTSLVFLTWSVIGATAVYPFRNPKLPFHERVDDLVC